MDTLWEDADEQRSKSRAGYKEIYRVRSRGGRDGIRKDGKRRVEMGGKGKNRMKVASNTGREANWPATSNRFLINFTPDFRQEPAARPFRAAPSRSIYSLLSSINLLRHTVTDSCRMALLYNSLLTVKHSIHHVTDDRMDLQALLNGDVPNLSPIAPNRLST